MADNQKKPKATYEIDWSNPSDNELVEFVECQYENGKARRASWEADAAEQLAWVRGNQTMRWDESVGDLVEMIESDELRRPISINMLRAFAEHHISLVIGQPVNWHAKPQSPDDEDIASARCATRLLQYYFSSGPTGTLVKFLESLWMMYCTGLSFIRAAWDPFAGPSDRFKPDEHPDEDEDVRSAKREEFREKISGKLGKSRDAVKLGDDGGIDLPGGDIDIEFPSGFDVTEPNNCRSVGEAAWLICSRWRTVEYVRERYGEKAESVEAESTSDAYHYRRREQYGEWRNYTSGGSSDIPSDEVLVHELWRPRSMGYPLGYRCVVAGGKILRKGKHPYLHGRLPFVALREMPDPEHFRPGCTIRDLMDLQYARNRSRSQVHTHIDLTVDPKILAEKTAGLPDDAFKSGAKVIPVNAGAASGGMVQPWVPPPLPAHVLDVDEMNRRDMEDVAGVHRSTMGQRESSSQSGKHAAIMQEGDRRGSTVTRMLVEEALGKAGQQVLWLIYQFVGKERAITISGRNSEPMVMTFKGEDLVSGKRGKQNPSPNEWNIEVVLGTNPDMTAVLAKIDLLTERGYMRPDRESDRLTVLKWLGEKVTQDVDEYVEHRMNAAMEHRRLLDGSPVRVMIGDDDAVHIHEHELFTIESEFRTAALRRPELVEETQIHIREHYFNAADKKLRPQATESLVKELLRGEMASAVPGKTVADPGAAPSSPAPGIGATPFPMGMPAEDMGMGMGMNMGPPMVGAM